MQEYAKQLQNNEEKQHLFADREHQQCPEYKISVHCKQEKITAK